MQTLADEQSECDGNEKAKGKAKEKPKKGQRKAKEKRCVAQRHKAWQKGE